MTSELVLGSVLLGWAAEKTLALPSDQHLDKRHTFCQLPEQEGGSVSCTFYNTLFFKKKKTMFVGKALRGSQRYSGFLSDSTVGNASMLVFF